MSGDILDDIDAAIEEAEGYVEWHGSADQGSWYEILRDALERPLDREVFDPQWVRYIVPTPLIEWSMRWRDTWREIQYDATVTRDGAILWHRDLPPDPAETLRDVVVHWTASEDPPARPIEAVLREVAAAEEES